MVKSHKNDSKSTTTLKCKTYQPIENLDIVNEIYNYCRKYYNALLTIRQDELNTYYSILRKHSVKVSSLENQIKITQQEICIVQKEKNDSKEKEEISENLKTLYKKAKGLRTDLTKLRKSEKARLKKEHKNPMGDDSQILKLQEQHKKASGKPNIQGKINLQINKLKDEYRDISNINIDLDLSKIDITRRKKTLRQKYLEHLLWNTATTIEDFVKQATKSTYMPRYREKDSSCIMGGQPSTKGISVQHAFEGTHGFFRITSADDRCTLGHVHRTHYAWLRIYSTEKSKPVWTIVPFILHRTLLPTDTITQIKLKRGYIGTKEEWSLHLTLKEGFENNINVATGHMCAIDLNWRVVTSDSGRRLRVASWGGDDKKNGELFLPKMYLDHNDNVKQIQSVRDDKFNVVRNELAEWLKDNDIPTWLNRDAKTIKLWKSIKRLKNLIYFWKDNRFDGDSAIFKMLDGNAKDYIDRKHNKRHYAGWRNYDDHLYNFQCSLRHKIINARNDMYRKFAVDISRQYKVVLMENLNNAQMNKKHKDKEKDIPYVRKYSSLAAVASLRSFMKCRVSELYLVPPQYTSMKCNKCGKINKKNSDIVFKCKYCECVDDRDENAWKNILKTDKIKWKRAKTK